MHQVEEAHEYVQQEGAAHLGSPAVQQEGMQPRHDAPQTQGREQARPERPVLDRLEGLHQGDGDGHQTCSEGHMLSHPMSAARCAHAV